MGNEERVFPEGSPCPPIRRQREPLGVYVLSMIEQLMQKSVIEIPGEISGELPLVDVWLTKTLKDFLGLKNEYKVIQCRFGLNEYSPLTLDDTGMILEPPVTRERVRQIEQRALINLSELTKGEIRRGMQLRQDIVDLLHSYKSSLVSLGNIANEQVIVNHAKEFFSVININVPLHRLLLYLLGYKSVDLETDELSHRFAWALNEFETTKIQEAIIAISGFLKKVAIAKTLDEIKLALNKERKAEKRFGDYELMQAASLSFDIENVDKNKFQIRYQKLGSVTDKAYRILFNADESMHVRQIAILLNKEACKHGEASKVTPHHIGARLSSDSRFASIGRSGEWFLVEWKRFSAEFILDLMENALHSAGEPLSAKAIYDFVHQKRPVEKKAIDSYLRLDNRFVRVGVDQFALRNWGLTSVSIPRIHRADKVFSKAKLCEYIEVVFMSKQVGEMFLVDLSQEIPKLEPKVSSQSIYNSIIKSPAVKIVDQQMGRKRKIAIFVPNYRTKLTRLDILTRDISVGDLIQSTIRRVIENQPKKQLELATVRDLVSTELTCPPASVYSALKKMVDIEKFRNTSNQMICRVVKSDSCYDEQIGRIVDKQLANEISRAVNLANIDSIDLALFQIGKIFEHTLRKFMLEVQTRNLLPVTADDLSKLYKMVQWAGKTGLVADETALQYLRIERNGRAHGAPAARDEREALLKIAPTLIPIYLDYIILLENRRANLK